MPEKSVYIKERDEEIIKFIKNYGSATIDIIAKIFYKNNEFGYAEARKRLKKLLSVPIFNLKTTNTIINRKLVYYIDKPLSAHGLYVLKFYAELINQGCTNVQFKREKQWMNGSLRSDAFIEFVFKDELRLICLEVDFTHKCNLKKYEKLFESREIQEQYSEYTDGIDIFPQVVIVTNVLPTNPYQSENFDVVFLDYNLNDFTKKVLL